MSGLNYIPANPIANFINSYVPISSIQTGGATMISLGILVGLIVVLVILLLVRRYKKSYDDAKQREQFNVIQKKREERIKKQREKERAKKAKAKKEKHVRFDI